MKQLKPSVRVLGDSGTRTDGSRDRAQRRGRNRPPTGHGRPAPPRSCRRGRKAAHPGCRWARACFIAACGLRQLPVLISSPGKRVISIDVLADRSFRAWQGPKLRSGAGRGSASNMSAVTVVHHVLSAGNRPHRFNQPVLLLRFLLIARVRRRHHRCRARTSGVGTICAAFWPQAIVPAQS